MLQQLLEVEEQFTSTLDNLRAIIATLEGGVADVPSHTDVREELPVNPSPDEAWMVANNIKDWWTRAPEQINGITIHHMAGTSTPAGVAGYITKSRYQGGKGLPRTQYHWQVDIDGKIWHCLDEKYGCWHDNCGHQNKHVAVVMNGALHINQPSTAQLNATASLVKYLMNTYNVSIEDVRGHNEAAIVCTGQSVTVCPGWNNAGWKSNFYTLLGQPGAQAASIKRSWLLNTIDRLTTSYKQELDSLSR